MTIGLENRGASGPKRANHGIQPLFVKGLAVGKYLPMTQRQKQT
jgi:hypothetical protein